MVIEFIPYNKVTLYLHSGALDHKKQFYPNTKGFTSGKIFFAEFDRVGY